MMIRALKAFPKAFVIVSVLVLSTGLFGFWWWFGGGQTTPPADIAAPPAPSTTTAEREEPNDRAQIASTLPERVGNLLLINRDLYDVESEELLIENWLNGAEPLAIFFDEKQQKFIGKFPSGLARYHLDGSEAGTIASRNGILFPEDFDFAIYADGGDVWKASIDWTEFKLTNPIQVTSVGSFSDRSFAQNTLLGTDRFLVVRNQNQFLRIGLETGEVVTTVMDMNGLGSRRSPSGDMMVGSKAEVSGTKFYAYDVDLDEVKLFELETRLQVTAYRWLNKDRCAFLIANQQMGLYEREKNDIRFVAKLPFPCRDMVGPSPDGRYVLCGSAAGVLAVDFESNEVHRLGAAGQVFEWIANDTLLVAADVQDTNQRGTWRIQIGQEPVRITNEPYLFTRDGKGSVARVNGADLAIFQTKSGLFTMSPKNLRARLFKEFEHDMTSITPIVFWKS